jgi:hypothetical protein
MITRLLIYFLFTLSSSYALDSMKTTFDLSEVKDFKLYSNYMLTATHEKIKLYQDELEFKWELNNLNYNFHSFKFEFDTVYALDKQNKLYQININSGVEEEITNIKNIDYFDVRYPYIIALSKNNTLYAYDITKNIILWDLKVSCSDLFFMAINEYVGCLDKKQLTLYDTLQGKPFYTQTENITDLSFYSSDNDGAYFKQGNKIIYLNVRTKQFELIYQEKNDISSIIRQKEMIVIDRVDSRLKCLNIKSKSVRWVYPIEKELTLIQHYPGKILIEDNNHFKLLNNFSGTIELNVTNNLNLEVEALHVFKNKYYFMTKNKTYLVVKDQ